MPSVLSISRPRQGPSKARDDPVVRGPELGHRAVAERLGQAGAVDDVGQQQGLDRTHLAAGRCSPVQRGGFVMRRVYSCPSCPIALSGPRGARTVLRFGDEVMLRPGDSPGHALTLPGGRSARAHPHRGAGTWAASRRPRPRQRYSPASRTAALRGGPLHARFAPLAPSAPRCSPPPLMLGSSKPIPFDPYRRSRARRGPPRWLLLLLLGVVLGAAAVLYVQERHLPPRLGAEASTRLRESFERADAERQRLQAELTATAGRLRARSTRTSAWPRKRVRAARPSSACAWTSRRWSSRCRPTRARRRWPCAPRASR